MFFQYNVFSISHNLAIIHRYNQVSENVGRFIHFSSAILDLFELRLWNWPIKSRETSVTWQDCLCTGTDHKK